MSHTAFVEAMNWTGGSLQRTKQANAGVVQRQKAYFAKARANPQNTHWTSVAPFCPSFLRNDGQLGPGGLSSSGSYSVRRGERSMASGGEKSQREHVATTPENKWSAISGRGVSPRELSSRRVTHHLVHPEDLPQAQQDLGRFKRKAPDTSVEMQNFEANKKRLLTQQDWIGVNASKAVSLHSLAYKQNETIDGRITTNRKCSVAKRQHDQGKSSRGDADRHNGMFAKPFQGRTRREKPENIRIRIGTDALIDELRDFTRAEGYAESEPCSDVMLFEQDGPLADESVGQAMAEPSVISQKDVPANGDEHDDLCPQVSATDGDARHYEDVPGCTKWTLDNKHDKLLMEQAQVSRMTRDIADSAKFGIGRVDRTGDDEYSVRHAFRGSSGSSAGAVLLGSHNLGVMDGQETCETRLLGEPEWAAASRAERVYRATNDSEGRGAYAIVDQRPWRAYVAISDKRPQPYDASIHSRQVLQLDDTTTRNKSGVGSSWSQCATQGQGDVESFDTSHSDSVSWLRRVMGKSVTESVAEMAADGQSESKPGHVQTLDEDEMNWQAFVLG